MNKRQLVELTRVNLRYANPQVTEKIRKKGKSGKQLTRSLINQYILSGLIFIVIYGFMMIMTDFSRMPGFFTYYVALFGLLGLSQGITVIYNVFFEGNDLQTFLPLPFKQAQIFLAKILVVALTVTPFVFPLLILFLLTGWRAGVFLPVTILLSVILFVLFLLITFSICSLIVFGMARTAFFQKHKRLVTSLLLSGSMLVGVVGILLMNTQNSSFEVDGSFADRGAIAFLLPLFYAVKEPFTSAGALSIAGVLLLAVLLAVIINKALLPKLYEQLTAANQSAVSKRKRKTHQNLRQLLFSYNSQLVRDPNLIMQVISTSLMTPIIFIFAFAFGGKIALRDLDIRFIGVVFVTGIVLAALTVNQTSFISNLISLDQENFLFIRSLPISLKAYLKEKFRFGCLLQMVITGLIALLGGFSFGLPLIFIASLVLGSLLGSYLLSLRYFARDYRLMFLHWTNISQLFSRGGGNTGMILGMLLSMFISIILLVIYGMAALYFSFWLVNGIAFLLILIACVWWITYYQKRFWSKLE